MTASSNPESTHNQPIADPVAHFREIDWCNKILTNKSIVNISIPDRTPIASTESALVRETLNTSNTVKACVTFLRYIKLGSKQEMEQRGETKHNPFLEVGAILDLQSGVNGFAKTMHGGVFGVVLDEVCGTAANMQAKHGALTASLTVNFKKSLHTPAVVVCRGRVVKKEGKKLFLKGSFEDKDGNILAQADGIWILVEKEIGRWTDDASANNRERTSKL
ncbi:HotDog domain-containing protein [Tricladium varicosporioides]|nr:HotDog domain-containing protein [Hymenoscyphus varicosporioides]